MPPRSATAGSPNKPRPAPRTVPAQTGTVDPRSHYVTPTRRRCIQSVSQAEPPSGRRMADGAPAPLSRLAVSGRPPVEMPGDGRTGSAGSHDRCASRRTWQADSGCTDLGSRAQTSPGFRSLGRTASRGRIDRIVVQRGAYSRLQPVKREPREKAARVPLRSPAAVLLEDLDLGSCC